jgi:NAD(P)-dependent dehydrogenase (short-subunit alcohol dehydrogenase family)
MSTALITGASSGLGRALSIRLARDGFTIILVARHPEALQTTVEEIVAAGGTAHAIAADVGERTSATRIAGEAHALAGHVDVLIHCASTLGETPLRLVADTAPDAFDEVLQVNLAGPFRLTKALVGPMLLRGRGTVVFVSSDAAVEGYPTWGAYGASKAGLDQLARVWAAELAGTGVRVVSIDPGDMDTPMHAAAIPDADPSTLARPDDVAARIADLLGELPPVVRMKVAS